MALVILVEAFERFLKEVAAECVDCLANFIVDDRFNAFKIQGSGLASHFGSGTLGKSLCESSTWLDCEEINDRFRNSNPSQGVGYPMGSLQSLYMQAELLALAGYEPYGYRGAHGQSIEMATDYYACFAKTAEFRKTITAETSKACPNAQEYVGRVVNGVDTNVVIGAYRFPGDAALSELDAAAKASASLGPFSLEPILYGKWRD